MKTNLYEAQASDIVPSRSGSIFVVTLDTTSRRYDLGLMALGGKDLTKSGELYLTLFGDVKFYYFTSPTDAGTVDETAALAAAGTAAFTANGCWEVPASTPEHIRIHRVTDRWLVLKGSAAGKLRVRASSVLVTPVR